MKVLVVIPARGGSKGIPGKNIKLLNGIPLINYTISAAREVFDDADIFVSTDDTEIKKVVENTGLLIPFLRPDYLATDTATSYDVIMNALDIKKKQGVLPDIVILLQPTSPFRKGKHIREALRLYHDDLDMVTSVKLTKSNPYYVLFEENENGYLDKSKKGNFTRRQDMPNVYELNGAIYVMNVLSLMKKEIGAFKKIIKYEMDDLSSHDIDDEVDWMVAEQLVKNF